MGKVDLKPNENILFPSPYMEDEKNPLIVTTMRVLWSGDGKKTDLDATKITYTGKGNNPQIMSVVVLLFILGLPFAIFGAYKYLKYRNLPMEPPTQVDPKAPPSAFSRAQYEQFSSNKTNFIVGVVAGVFGVALGGGAYLLYKRRLMVVIGGAGKVMKIPVKDTGEQDKLLTMVGAAQTAAKAMAPQAIPAKVAKPPPAAGGK